MGADFDAAIARLMPTHGQLLFSSGCLRDSITDDCKQAVLGLLQGKDLSPSLKTELDALFETDTMIQIQMDSFVALVEGVPEDLKRMFPDAGPSPEKISGPSIQKFK